MVEVIQQGQCLPAIHGSMRFRGVRLGQCHQRISQTVLRAFIPSAPLFNPFQEILGGKPNQLLRVGTQYLADLLLNGMYFHRGSGSFGVQGGDQSGQRGTHALELDHEVISLFHGR